MLIAEILIGIGLVCVMVAVAKLAYWAGKKVEKHEMENQK